MKKTIIVLSILLPLSLGAMEEKAAAPAPSGKKQTKRITKDQSAWKDFTPDKFIGHTVAEEIMIQIPSLRAHLLWDVSQEALSREHIVDLIAENKSHAVISGHRQHYIITPGSPLDSENAIIIFCQNLARLEAFIAQQGKSQPIHILRELEESRRNHLILLSTILKLDNFSYIREAHPHDLPEYFKKTHKEWSEKYANDPVLSRLSSYIVVTSALKKRVKNRVDTIEQDNWKYEASFRLIKPEESTDSKLE